MANIQKKIVPCLWFDHNAEEAVDFYISVFSAKGLSASGGKDAKVIDTSYYPSEGLADFQQEFAGKVLTIIFELNGMQFMALNAGPEFKFNESVSFLINCRDQDEIDYYWEALTKDGGEESVCGWLKDKYGLSWQVAPDMIDSLVTKNPKAFAAMMQMKKIIIADLEKAAEGK